MMKIIDYYLNEQPASSLKSKKTQTIKKSSDIPTPVPISKTKIL